MHTRRLSLNCCQARDAEEEQTKRLLEPPGNRTQPVRCSGSCTDQQFPASCRCQCRTPLCSRCVSLNACDRRVPPAWRRTGSLARHSGTSWQNSQHTLVPSSSCRLVVAQSVWTYVTLCTRVLSVLRKLVSLLTNQMTRTEVTVASSGRDLISSSCLDVRLGPSWLPFMSFASCLSIVC